MSASQQFGQSSRFHQRHRHSVAAVVVLAWLASCSLQDLDKLGPGNSNAGGTTGEGGTDSAGGTTNPTLGGSTSAQAGAYARQSSGNAGTVNGVAGSAGRPESAGAAGKAGIGGAGGTPLTRGGAPNGSGGTTGIAGTTSRDSTCPAYLGTGGTLVTPPSNTFELDVSGWTTVSARTAAISRGQGGANACDGSAYLACNGAMRQSGWDGPAVDILPYVLAGHSYAVTVAARYDPSNAPAAAKSLRIVCAKTCSDSAVAVEYGRVAEQFGTFSWVRLSGNITPSLTGCTTLRKLLIYVETDDAEVTYSLHVDDFRLYDTTVGSGGSGAGGSGTAGSGTAGSGTAGSGTAGGGSVLAGSAGMLNASAAGTAGRGG